MSEETPATQTYESATARLEEIIQRLDSGDAQLRETLDLCGEAKALIEYCAGELAAVDQGLKELRLDDLASSLTSATPVESDPETDQESHPAPPGSPPPTDSDVPF